MYLIHTERMRDRNGDRYGERERERKEKIERERVSVHMIYPGTQA